MFTQAAAGVPISARIDVSPAMTAPELPVPITLEEAIGQAGMRPIPTYDPAVRLKLAKGELPSFLMAEHADREAPRGPRSLAAWLTFRELLPDSLSWHSTVLDIVAAFVAKEINVGHYSSEEFRHFLEPPHSRDLNSIMPGLAAMASDFENDGRTVLYEGAMHLFGASDHQRSSVPPAGSPLARIYNVLFSLPRITEDLSNLTAHYESLDRFVDALELRLGG